MFDGTCLPPDERGGRVYKRDGAALDHHQAVDGLLAEFFVELVERVVGEAIVQVDQEAVVQRVRVGAKLHVGWDVAFVGALPARPLFRFGPSLVVADGIAERDPEEGLPVCGHRVGANVLPGQRRRRAVRCPDFPLAGRRPAVEREQRRPVVGTEAGKER